MDDEMRTDAVLEPVEPVPLALVLSDEVWVTDPTDVVEPRDEVVASLKLIADNELVREGAEVLIDAVEEIPAENAVDVGGAVACPVDDVVKLLEGKLPMIEELVRSVVATLLRVEDDVSVKVEVEKGSAVGVLDMDALDEVEVELDPILVSANDVDVDVLEAVLEALEGLAVETVVLLDVDLALLDVVLELNVGVLDDVVVVLLVEDGNDVVDVVVELVELVVLVVLLVEDGVEVEVVVLVVLLLVEGEIEVVVLVGMLVLLVDVVGVVDDL